MPVPVIPTIHAVCQGRDRRLVYSGVTPSVFIGISPDVLSSFPVEYAGFLVERSTNGVVWTPFGGLITSSFYLIDRPGAGTFYYRAKTENVDASQSGYSSIVTVTVADWSSFEAGALVDQDLAGGLVDQAHQSLVPPNGLGRPSLGSVTSEGSLAGSLGDGAWMVDALEQEPPILQNNVPACGTVDVALPVNSITYTLRDMPFPGGSGIDATSIRIWLSVTSENAGAYRLVWDGVAAPWSPTVAVSIVAGGDPVLERDVTLTLAVGYIKSADVVAVRTQVSDLAGNSAVLNCSFTMETVDTIPPVVDQQAPVCGTGLTAGDLQRVPRDTSYAFRVTDDVAVSLASLQVSWGIDSAGPWTQVLQNGSVWLLGYSGTVTAISGVPVSGYEVVIHRPGSDPLWPADTKICFKVDVGDTAGNTVSDVCCFQTGDTTKIREVYVIGERMLLVEFTAPLTNNDDLRNPANWTLTDTSTNLPVTIHRLDPNKLVRDGASDRTIEFPGDPRFVFVFTHTQITYELHTLSVANIVDRYSQPVSGDAFTYRSRRTKWDGVTEDFVTLSGSPTEMYVPPGTEEVDPNALLATLLYGSDAIGGVFLSDDWEAK